MWIKKLGTQYPHGLNNLETSFKTPIPFVVPFSKNFKHLSNFVNNDIKNNNITIQTIFEKGKSLKSY